MLRNSLLVSALLLTGSFGFAGAAKAVTEPVDFTGTVPTACMLTTPVDGLLGVSGDNKMLSSTIGSGTAAKIDIDCAGGSLTVSAPVKDELASDTGTTVGTSFSSLTAKVTTTDLDTEPSGGSGLPLDAANKGTATVEMTATDDVAILPGKYTFTVTVTATPAP
jgi:hypothetical protein